MEEVPESEQMRWRLTREEHAQELKKATRLAAPMVAVSVLQYLVQVASVVAVGHLGQLSLSTALPSPLLWLMSPASVSITRVSNELGAGNPNQAKVVVLVISSLAIIEAIIVGIVLFCCRYVLGYAYSSEKQVVHYIGVMTPLICLSIFMDSLQAVLSGVARGSGWQKIGAYINIGAFYLVGLPIGLILGFVLHLRAKGFWIGIISGTAVQLALLSVITRATNWQKQANETRTRIFARNPHEEQSDQRTRSTST
ncbi:hypothetical protein NL676_005450 [Syzygium grande]|nr:hypothetical protein NL676_005450 [Syzygium grande]